jgi:hypothetical protein
VGSVCRDHDLEGAVLGGVELQDMGGAAAIEAKINAAIGSVNGTQISIVAGGSRGQSKNTLIAKVQQKQLRNPFYLDQQAMEAIRFAARGLMAAAYSTRKRATEIMGELMLNAIGRNVEKQTNPGGSKFKDLTANYAAYKQRVHGFKVPILKATNDLLGGLKVVISKLR